MVWDATIRFARFYLPQQRLNFFPLPHGQGSFLPTFLPVKIVMALFRIFLTLESYLDAAARSLSVIPSFRSISTLQLCTSFAPDHVQSMTMRSSSSLVSIPEMAFSRQVAQSQLQKGEAMKRLIATSSSDAAGISIIEFGGTVVVLETLASIDALMRFRVLESRSRREHAARRR